MNDLRSYEFGRRKTFSDHLDSYGPTKLLFVGSALLSIGGALVTWMMNALFAGGFIENYAFHIGIMCPLITFYFVVMGELHLSQMSKAALFLAGATVLSLEILYTGLLIRHTVFVIFGAGMLVTGSFVVVVLGLRGKVSLPAWLTYLILQSIAIFLIL